MSRMIDLVRASAVPANLMQAAARGALSVPADEMIEILVHLANHNKVFGQLARMTLAGWDEKASLVVAANPKTPQEVLEYWAAPENLRPKLLPALVENPALSKTKLAEMAATGSREVVVAMRGSTRVQTLPEIMQALASNPNATQTESDALSAQAGVLEEQSGVERASADESAATQQEGDMASDQEIDAYLSEHAKELAQEGEKPFQPLGGFYELEHLGPETGEAVVEAASQDVIATALATPATTVPTPATTVPTPATSVPTPASATAKTASAGAAKPAMKRVKATASEERGSSLQKINKLDVKGRIQLAMKGNKEERSILIRDGTKLVALAVLESGKITDGEVEKFASQKNVLEAVLRAIPMKRRFTKNYNVLRNLVANPRTPIDVALGLMKHILVADLRHLSSNKEVSETIRKLALKMFKQKTDTSKRS
jgi:hypothetical protein